MAIGGHFAVFVQDRHECAQAWHETRGGRGVRPSISDDCSRIWGIVKIMVPFWVP